VPSSRLAVVAIGGNSLIADERHQGLTDQLAAVRQTAEGIAAIVAEGWRMVVTHGNGPQVGQILLCSELAAGAVPPVPIAFAVAQTEGAIGLMVQQALGNALRQRGLDRPVATVITQVVVDPDDPSFQRPTKPVGPFLDRARAESYRAELGWEVAEDSGRGWRRVVPSPHPLEIVEMPAIRALSQAGTVVVASGGGGIPVARQPNGDLTPVDAVIDKDRAAALLAVSLRADLFVISTAVERVALSYQRPDQVDLDWLTVEEAHRHLDAGQFPPGSMGPKVEAAASYALRTGRSAVIASPAGLPRVLTGETGTWVVPTVGVRVRRATVGVGEWRR